MIVPSILRIFHRESRSYQIAIAKCSSEMIVLSPSTCRDRVSIGNAMTRGADRDTTCRLESRLSNGKGGDLV